MTTKQFQKFTEDFDLSLKALRSEIERTLSDQPEVKLAFSSLIMKLRVGFRMISNQVTRIGMTESDLHYQNDEWLGSAWPRESNL